MKEHKIIVSRQFNDGRAVPLDWFEDFETKLVAEFQGFTRIDGKGGYKMKDGTTKFEPVFIYTVAGHLMDCDGPLKRLGAWAKFSLYQESIYIVLDNQVMFV